MRNYELGVEDENGLKLKKRRENTEGEIENQQEPNNAALERHNGAVVCAFRIQITLRMRSSSVSSNSRAR